VDVHRGAVQAGVAPGEATEEAKAFWERTRTLRREICDLHARRCDLMEAEAATLAGLGERVASHASALRLENEEQLNVTRGVRAVGSDPTPRDCVRPHAT
jgi:hypothetical protein